MLRVLALSLIVVWSNQAHATMAGSAGEILGFHWALIDRLGLCGNWDITHRGKYLDVIEKYTTENMRLVGQIIGAVEAGSAE